MTTRVRVAAAVCLALLPLTLLAQGPAQATGSPRSIDDILSTEKYLTPPPELAAAVLAPRHLNVSLANASPDKKWFLDEIGDGPVTMAVFSKPFHELGGAFIDFRANRARTLTVRSNAGIQIISAADGTRRTIQVPPGARVSNARWSPDGTAIAFFAHTDEATHIWMADVATGRSRQITPKPVLATFVTSFDFTADGGQIAAVLIPEPRAAMPVAAAVPTGPEVKLTDPEKNRIRTYPSLLHTLHDQALLEWHATGQVASIDVQTRTVKKIGQPAMARSVDVSPDGRHLRLTRMTKPFSYIVPVSSFGSIDEVWDAAGKVMAKISERPLNLGVQSDDDPADPAAGGGGRGGQNQQGRREVAWRADGKGLTFLEQEPAPAGERSSTLREPQGRPERRRGATGSGQARGGRAAGRGFGAAVAAPDDTPGQDRPSGRKDRVFQWLPPFDASSLKVIYESNTRMSNHRFSPDMQALFLSERSGQNTVEYAVYLSEPSKRYTLARYRNEDFYANPGSIVSVRSGGDGGGRGGGGRGGGGGGGGGGGTVLLSADGSSVFFEGTQYDKDPLAVGPKSFIDKVAIKTGDKQRIYESDNTGVFERVTTILDAEAGRYIVARESPMDVEQNYLLEGGTRTQLTKNEDLAPDLTRAPKERFTVERPDGFTFRVNVTLPPGYQRGTRLPALFWFYPREFAGQEEYDRGARAFNKNAFQDFGMRSMHYFVRLGYALVEPDAPIVGAQGQMNNNYENDLRNNLAAVIDELDKRSIVDRSRLALGGHSYGAFSTVNAMVHTPFFRAGIAGDGDYNRTLTPFSFQNERRSLWEARDVYLSMSPFLFADHLTGALLMYHNLGDQNVGTDPINSMRLFDALNALGKTAALYLYPYEDHGPVAKETLLDMWARWGAWLDKHVKNAGKPPEKKITSEQQ